MLQSTIDKTKNSSIKMKYKIILKKTFTKATLKLKKVPQNISIKYKILKNMWNTKN